MATLSATTISGSLNVSGSINGVKRYVATFTQSGTGNPSATIFENTFGEVPTWTRELVAGTTVLYNLTFAGSVLTENKTTRWSVVRNSGNPATGLILLQGARSSDTVYGINTRKVSDNTTTYDFDSSALFILEVYP